MRDVESIPIGSVVLDTETGNRGIVMDTTSGVCLPRKYVWLRPEGGGLEWLATVRFLHPVNANETGADCKPA